MNTKVRYIVILTIIPMLLLQSIIAISLTQAQSYPIYITDIYLSNNQGQKIYDVAPGDILYLNIVLVRMTPGNRSQITGAILIQSRSSYLKPYPSEASFTIPFTSSKEIDVLTLSTEVLIDNSTPIGSNIILDITLMYIYPSNTTNFILNTYTIYVSGKPSITIGMLQHEVETGLQRIDLVISNQGTLTATNIQVSIASLQQSVYVYNSSITIPNIGAGKSVNIPIYTYIPQTMQNSVIQLQVQASFISSMGTSYEETMQIPLRIVAPSEQILDVKANTTILVSNNLNKVTLTIINRGPYNIRSLNASLSSQQLSIVKDSFFSLGSINTNSSATLQLLVYTPYINSITQVQLTVSVTYMDEYLRVGSTQFVLQFYLMPQQVKVPVVLVYPTSMKALNNETLKICVINPLNTTLSNVQLSISLPQQLLVINGGSNTAYLGNILPNSNACVSIPVVATNQPGMYKLGVQLSYIYGLAYLTQQYEYTLNIQPIVIGINIAPNQQTLSSPSSSNMTLVIKNTGEVPIYRVYLTLSSSSNQLVLGLTSENIDYIPPGGSINIDIPVMSTVPSPTTAVITSSVQYMDAVGSLYTYSKSIVVQIAPNTTYPSIDIYATTLIAGSNNTIVIRIVNSGDSSLLNTYLSLSISPSSLFAVNSSPMRIGYIEPRSVRNIPIVVYVPPDVSSSATAISATLTYIDSQLNVQNSITVQKSVTINVLPSIIVVDQSVIPQTVTVGSMFTVSLTIMNIGPGNAYELRVYPNLSMLPIRAVSQSTVYIGTLSQDRSASVSFTLMLLNATGFNATFTRTFTPRYPRNATTTETSGPRTTTPSFAGFGRIPIVIEFNDNLRNTHRNIIYVGIQVSQQSSTQQSTRTAVQTSSGYQLWLMIVLGVVVVGVVGVLIAMRFRRSGKQ